jgi:hypothetical protein
VTCRTLFALISAAMVWNLPNITLAQAMQGDSEQSLDPPTNAKEAGSETEAILKMQAKKAPVKAKKGAAPAKAGKGKVPPKPAAKPAPKLIPKPGKPASRPAPKATPFFPPAPPTQLDPVDNSRFQVPMPEEKGDLNIWGDDPSAASAGASGDARNQFGLVGVGNFMGTGFGLEYLRRSFSWLDWGVQVTATQTRLTSSKNPETDEFLATEMSAARFSLRLFNRRWLYFGTGLSMAMIQGRYGWEGPGVVDEEISSEFKAQLLVLDFVLGSQWEFGSMFYVGVDWLGFGLPLAGSLNYTENSDLDDLTSILTGSSTDERIPKELGAQFRPYYGLLKFGIKL